MLNQDKIKKLLQEDMPSVQSISKSRHRIDILTVKYKGRPIQYEWYPTSDYMWVATRAKTLKSPKRLIAIVQIDVQEFVTSVLENKHITPQIIEYIYFHTSHKVLILILEHKRTPKTVLNDIIQNSKNVNHIIMAIKHRQTSPEMIKRFVQKESQSVIMQAVARKVDTVEDITKIYERFSDDEIVIHSLCGNDYTPTRILTAIINSRIRPTTYIATHENMTPELLARLYTNISFFYDTKNIRRVKVRLAENPKTPVHIMKALLLENDDYFLDEVIENSTFKLQVKRRYTARNATEVLFVSDDKVTELLDNDGTPAEMLRAIFCKVKENEKALRKLIKHPNIDESLTEEIIQFNRNYAFCINSKFEFYCDEEKK